MSDIIDVNASFGFWPFQKFSLRTLDEMDEAYARERIETVWISANEAILLPENEEPELSLFSEINRFSRFKAVKTIDPSLRNWRVKSIQTIKEYDIKAIKIFPNYHHYDLDSAPAVDLYRFAADCGLPVLVQMRVNDERNQPFCCKVPGVSVSKLAEVSKKHPDVTFIALSAYFYFADIAKLVQGGSNLLFDIAYMDFDNTLDRLVECAPLERIVFGSASPFLHLKSASLKLEHCNLNPLSRQAIASENLKQALDRSNKKK